MSAPDYRAFLTVKGTDPDYLRSINRAAEALSLDMVKLRQLSGGDADKINPVIDNLVEQFIISAGGDPRLAVFGALAAYGAAMRVQFGPPGGR